ncbi:HSP20 family protein [Gammaproteobacteria bacterium]
MSVLRYYDPWVSLAKVQEEMNRHLFNRANPREAENGTVVTADWMPTVDIKEEPERFLLHADIPGVECKDIEVTMDGGVLSIKGERHFPTPEEQSGFKRVERPYGIFYRRFALPDVADTDRVTARGNNGVIEIVIPKQSKVQPRKIAVEA